MAVDTRNKRASVLGFALAALVVLPAPDATIDQADRQQTAFSYPGLLALPLTQIDVCKTTVVDLTPDHTVTDLTPTRTVTDICP